MKKVFAFLLCVFSVSCFAFNNVQMLACAKAPAPTDPNFCSGFKPIAICHCMADGGLPEKLCKDAKTGSIKIIHQRMVAAFGSQEAACRWQENNGSPERTTYQECMDDWNCYMKGGVDSKGGLCNATGSACE